MSTKKLIFEPMVPWLQWAQRELYDEIAEIKGEKHNPRILFYHEHTSLKATADEISWCSAFVCTALECVGVKSSGEAHARSYQNWGQGCLFHEGAIAVFWRVEPLGWQGHVGFAVKELEHSVLVLGGNQGNRVSLQHYPKMQLLGYRWPKEDDFKG